jgi:hypothetical protein
VLAYIVLVVGFDVGVVVAAHVLTERVNVTVNSVFGPDAVGLALPVVKLPCAIAPVELTTA